LYFISDLAFDFLYFISDLAFDFSPSLSLSDSKYMLVNVYKYDIAKGEASSGHLH